MLPDIASSMSESVGCGLLASNAAADLRAGHAEHVAQHPEERRVAVGIDAVCIPVDFNAEGHRCSPAQTRLIVTSMLPRVALEYGQIWCASSARAWATSRATPG